MRRRGVSARLLLGWHVGNGHCPHCETHFLACRGLTGALYKGGYQPCGPTPHLCRLPLPRLILLLPGMAAGRLRG